jgi:hypothetical protein
MFEMDVLKSSWGRTMRQDRLTHLRIHSRLTSLGTGLLPNSIMAILLPVKGKGMIRLDRASLFTPPICGAYSHVPAQPSCWQSQLAPYFSMTRSAGPLIVCRDRSLQQVSVIQSAHGRTFIIAVTWHILVLCFFSSNLALLLSNHSCLLPTVVQYNVQLPAETSTPGSKCNSVYGAYRSHSSSGSFEEPCGKGGKRQIPRFIAKEHIHHLRRHTDT